MDKISDIAMQINIPIVSSFLFGILATLSPCNLTTTITTIAYLSRHFDNKRKVIFSTIFYTLGRVLTYSIIGFIFLAGSNIFSISRFIQSNGIKILGPFLILISLFLLEILKFPSIKIYNSDLDTSTKLKSYLGSLILGIIFALAFCPYSGVLFFGFVIPISIQNIFGIFNIVIFALASALPIIIFAIIISYTMVNISNLFNNIKKFEIILRNSIGYIFLAIGIYFTYTYLLKGFINVS